MKKLTIFGVIIAFALSFFLFTHSVDASVRVKSYYRKNGTYVQSYHRTSPNYTKLDNYSTKGNYNPYTGKKGYASPYKTYKLR